MRIGQAYQYADDVLSGKIIACKFIRRACERWKHDHIHGAERGLIFDKDEAETAILFIEILKQHKGRMFIGKRLRLQPWQIFHFANLFGWFWKKDKTRRFRHSYLTVGRKNGKTQMAAAVGLYMLMADGEGGAEVYSVANKTDQARISWTAAKAMVKQDSRLIKLLKINIQRIVYESTFSFFAPLATEYKTSDGAGPHCAIFDETHAMETRDMIEVITSGMGARQQPILYEITTTGFNTGSVAAEDWDYGRMILDGFDQPDGIKDDTFFPMIYTLDDGDDYLDERTWPKANPNLGVSLNEQFLRDELLKGCKMPRKLNYVLTKNFNLWVNAAEKWLPMDRWPESGKPFTIEELAGRECYGGLDLSARKDLTAFVLMFPPLTGEYDWKYLCWAYTPEDGIEDFKTSSRAPIDLWVDEGFITSTPGAYVDLDFVERDIKAAKETFKILGIGYDRWQALDIVKHLEDAGLTMIMVAQGHKTLSGPAKNFEGRLLERNISHGNNPVFRWCCDNAAIREDANGNVIPAKKASRGKIDLLAAALNAEAVRYAELPDTGPSIYETRKPIVI